MFIKLRFYIMKDITEIKLDQSSVKELEIVVLPWYDQRGV